MNGPDHYREAERLLNMAHRFTYGDGGDPVVGAALATEAQAHATLALAAATAMQAPTEDCTDGMTQSEYQAWYDAAGVRPAPKGDSA